MRKFDLDTGASIVRFSEEHLRHKLNVSNTKLERDLGVPNQWISIGKKISRAPLSVRNSLRKLSKTLIRKIFDALGRLCKNSTAGRFYSLLEKFAQEPNSIRHYLRRDSTKKLVERNIDLLEKLAEEKRKNSDLKMKVRSLETREPIVRRKTEKSQKQKTTKIDKDPNLLALYDHIRPKLSARTFSQLKRYLILDCFNEDGLYRVAQKLAYG